MDNHDQRKPDTVGMYATWSSAGRFIKYGQRHPSKTEGTDFSPPFVLSPNIVSRSVILPTATRRPSSSLLLDKSPDLLQWSTFLLTYMHCVSLRCIMHPYVCTVECRCSLLHFQRHCLNQKLQARILEVRSIICFTVKIRALISMYGLTYCRRAELCVLCVDYVLYESVTCSYGILRWSVDPVGNNIWMLRFFCGTVSNYII